MSFIFLRCTLSLTLTFKVDKELVRLLFASTAITALSLTPFTVLLDNCDKTRNIQCIGDKFRGYLQQLHWGGRHGTIKKNFYIDVKKNPIPKECNWNYTIYINIHTHARARIDILLTRMCAHGYDSNAC